MSCFIMHPDAIATVAEGLEKVLNMGYNVFGIEAPETLTEALAGSCLCTDKYGFFHVEKIYKALYTLNAAAYAERYREGLDDFIPAYPEKVKSLLPRPEWAAGRYIVQPEFYHYTQLLECLIYQCDEGSAAKTQLYKGLEEFKRRLWAFIIHNSAEYKSFTWGEV